MQTTAMIAARHTACTADGTTAHGGLLLSSSDAIDLRVHKVVVLLLAILRIAANRDT
jgi:hypothetical protein